MKNSAKLATTLLAALVITACGSSGGKSDNATNTNTNTNTPAVVPSSDSTGAVIVISGSNPNVKVETKKLKDTNLNFITVDGKAIRVAYTNLGISSGIWTSINSFATCCGKFSDVRFGIVDSKGPEENGHIFYNGNPSKTVPISGKANYSGYFVVAGQTAEFDKDDFLRGDATFAADFGSKTLSGTLTQATLKPINVNATIAGNSFTGSANSATFSTKANVEGKFFGNNAKELGGIFTDSKTWSGAFGAAKQ